jgi:hypothetical protein
LLDRILDTLIHSIHILCLNQHARPTLEAFHLTLQVTY